MISYKFTSHAKTYSLVYLPV